MYLSQKFDKVVVVPSLLLGSPQPTISFEVDPSLGRILQNASKFKIIAYAMANKFFYREIVARQVSFWNLAKLKRLIYFTGRGRFGQKMAGTKVESNHFFPKARFFILSG